MKNIWSFIAGLLPLVILSIVVIAIIYFIPSVSAKHVHDNDTILGYVTTTDPKTAKKFEIDDDKIVASITTTDPKTKEKFEIDDIDDIVGSVTTADPKTKEKFQVDDIDEIVGFVTTTDPKIAEQFEIDDIYIPVIKNYDVLEEAYNSSKDKKYLFNLTKEIFSAYEGLSVRANNKDWEDDVGQLSAVLDKLRDNIPIVDIIPITPKQKENMVKIHRHVESHSNYYCPKYVDTKYTTWYETLIELLSLDEENQQKVINIKYDEWVIWNWNSRTKKLEFCHIINDKDLQILFVKFKIACEKIIEKSKKNQS